MQFNTYTVAGAHIAVWLVNHPAPDAAALTAELRRNDVHDPEGTEQDAMALRSWASRLREVFEAPTVAGKAGLANSKLVYQEFKKYFSGDRWEKLAARGANVQRPLWASTSTKNPSYPDLLYVDNLIGPHTVNTVPPETLEAIFDHAHVAPTIEQGVDEARKAMEDLAAVGVDLDAVMAKLIEEGVSKFEKSFDALFEKLEEKRRALSGDGVAPQSVATHG